MATVFQVIGDSAKIASRLFLKPDGTVISDIKDESLVQQILVDERHFTLQDSHARSREEIGT
jgi:hypothetical protein